MKAHIALVKVDRKVSEGNVFGHKGNSESLTWGLERLCHTFLTTLEEQSQSQTHSYTLHA